jgi:hypothetical protein
VGIRAPPRRSVQRVDSWFGILFHPQKEVSMGIRDKLLALVALLSAGAGLGLSEVMKDIDPAPGSPSLTRASALKEKPVLSINPAGLPVRLMLHN